MSKKTDSTTLAIVEALRADSDARELPFNVLLNMASAFADQARTQGAVQRFERNTAPEIPDDKTPGKKYPDREELKPTPLPVPDPAETETATATKISIPNYGDAKPFAVAMGELATAASKLFEIESENQQDKDAARRVAFGWHDEVRSSIYDL